MRYKELPNQLNILIQHPKYRTYTYVGISLLFSMVFLFFFIRPALNEAATLIGTIERGEEAERALEQKLEDLAKAQTIIDRYRDSIQLVDRALPSEFDEANFVDALTRTAIRNRVTLSSISTPEQAASLERGLDYRTFRVIYKGDISDIINMIEEIENGLRLVSVGDISLSRDEGLYTANTLINIYIYKYVERDVAVTETPFIYE